MPHVVVMGVSGCGKTTVGQLLARHLGVTFIEGDELHPPHNVELMASGIPLTDEDRAGWLDAVAAELARQPEGAVASCSALRRRYPSLPTQTRRADPYHVGLDAPVLLPARVDLDPVADPASEDHFAPTRANLTSSSSQSFISRMARLGIPSSTSARSSK